MDVEISACRSQLSLALKVMQARRARLECLVSKRSRHYNRVQHTNTLISLLEELLGVVHQDPDLWDDEPDVVPF